MGHGRVAWGANLYRVISVAKHSETLEAMGCIRCHRRGECLVRLLSMGNNELSFCILTE